MTLHLSSLSRLFKASLGAAFVVGAYGCADEYYGDYDHGYRHDSVDAYAAAYPGEVVIVDAPPAPYYEPVPAPRYGYVWVGGYYAHDNHGYHWRQGRYEREPHRGARYESGHWQRVRGGYVWRDGRWR